MSYLAHPSASWGMAPSYSTPYHNAASIFSPVGTIQQANVFSNTQQIHMVPVNVSPTITTHQIQSEADNIFSVGEVSNSSSSGKSKIELEFEQQLEDAKKRHSELLAEQEKLKNGARGLKEELEKLQKTLEEKKKAKRAAESAFARQEQENISAAIAASVGGTLDEKKRYIGALQEAIKRKLNNLDALHLTISNYEAQATNDKRTISELNALQ